MPRALIFVFMFLLGIGSVAAEPINKFCPVTPEEQVDPNIKTIYQGQEIAFCCKRCMRQFNADPEAFLADIDQSANHEKMSGLGEGHGEHDHGNSSGHDVHKKAHDHSIDHGQVNGGSIERIIKYLGKLHVLVVHLPIALLTLAAVFELVGWLMKNSRLLFAARLNFSIGAASAIVAASFGWIAASEATYAGELAEFLLWHRRVGLLIAFISFIGLVSLFAKNVDCEWGAPFYRLCLFILAILVPINAHLGGSLVYGVNYLF